MSITADNITPELLDKLEDAANEALKGNLRLIQIGDTFISWKDARVTLALIRRIRELEK